MGREFDQLINSFEMQHLIFEVSTVETFATEKDDKPPTNAAQKAQIMTMHSRALNSEIYCKSLQHCNLNWAFLPFFYTPSHKQSALKNMYTCIQGIVWRFTGYFGILGGRGCLCRLKCSVPMSSACILQGCSVQGLQWGSLELPVTSPLRALH